MKKIKALKTIHLGVRGKGGAVEVQELTRGTEIAIDGDEAERLVRIGAAEFVDDKKSE